jgi:dipeptidyl aminopeptidase/acylaminoacyl peptidase
MYILFSIFIIIGGCSLNTMPIRKNNLPDIPLEDFFKNPEKSGFQLSPEGNYISYMKPWEKGNRRMNIFVKSMSSNDEFQLTYEKERGIYGYFWLNESRIAYVKDEGGDENVHIYAIDIDGKNEIDLTPFENIKAGIIDDLEDDINSMIIQLNKRDARIYDVYRLDVNTGALDMIAENPGNISSWMTDNEGKIRIAITTDGVNSSMLYRKDENSEFKEILKTNFKESVSPLFFTFDNKELYVSSNRHGDKSAIYKFDLDKGVETDLIFEHQEVDVYNLMKSKKRRIITGVSFYTDKQNYKFYDVWRKDLQYSLEKYFPGLEVRVSGLNKNETKAIVATFSDRSSGTYYYYDINKDILTKLADLSPWLNPENMSEMRPVQYKSRDGLTIHGYLTIPVGYKAENLPVVVNPHGGPWARDHWGFSPEIQYLANQGYAVFQMNFRGSTGYGRDFWESSFKQWGKTMQDDITDGVNWLINEGIANPDKIAIYGASYGGYATLAGLTFTPELYACGVDYVGISSLFTFLESMPPYWELYRDMMYEMVGNPEKDKELLASSSPLLHIDKIKSPLFIAQGANDPRVKKSESDQIVEALKKKGIDIPYMVKDNEGHGFYNEENQFDFYKSMGDFLEKYLK